MTIVDMLIHGREAEEAYLGVGQHAHSSWYRYVVDAIRLHERMGGDPMEAIRTLLVSINLDKSIDCKRRIDDANRSVQPPIIIPR